MRQEWSGREGGITIGMRLHGNLPLSSCGVCLVLPLQNVITFVPRWFFFGGGVKVCFPHSFLLLKEETGWPYIRRWYKTVTSWWCTYLHLHFRAWSLSTDTIQILHAIWIRDKVQMLVLNEKMWTPKPPWLVCRDQVYRCHLPPQGVIANCTQMWLPAPCMPVRMAGI